ncbi:hypothetical protein Sros01_63620 [Streptomyces roseochromogenus]|nr:hypothetical protein Sros01_63620 [Streptomyces roseochromogenus]
MPAAGDRHRLTALQGLAALSLDAMASVAYGPESIVLVLAAAGAYGMGFTLLVTLAIVALPAVLVASYRQVIAAFPDGGGSYAVAKRHLGRRTSLVATASLILDYVQGRSSRWSSSGPSATVPSAQPPPPGTPPRSVRATPPSVRSCC